MFLATVSSTFMVIEFNQAQTWVVPCKGVAAVCPKVNPAVAAVFCVVAAAVAVGPSVNVEVCVEADKMKI